MGLSTQQYNSIMLEYSNKRDRHRRELLRKKELVYEKIPEYKALEQSVPDMGMAALRRMLSDADASAGNLGGLKNELSQISLKMKQLLTENGFPEDFLSMDYDCPACKDTGYIDGKKCRCLIKRESVILYDQSNLSNLFPENNFSVLTDKYYTDKESLDAFRRAVSDCIKFIKNFNSDYENLYFYGTVGTGKSFLSICTAKELIDKGHSVLYFSASELFDRLARATFSRDRSSDTELTALKNDLYNCECLIIDDLGTEVMTSFVASELFACLNARDLNRRPTIISTNLSLRDLRERYSDRIFSRITSNFNTLKMTGPDIRLEKKVRK